VKEVPAVTIIPVVHRERWIRCLYDSYTLSRAFNADVPLRSAILKAKLVRQLPNLVKQETSSCGALITVLFAVYRVEDGDCVMLVHEIMDVLDRYVMFLKEPEKNARDIGMWSGVVVAIFEELCGIEGLWVDGGGGRGLRKEIERLFRYAVKIIVSDRGEVREALRVFMEKIAGSYLKVA
jgi:brefeldin A-inhibited guanine nucleotide-exchange protein